MTICLHLCQDNDIETPATTEIDRGPYAVPLPCCDACKQASEDEAERRYYSRDEFDNAVQDILGQVR